MAHLLSRLLLSTALLGLAACATHPGPDTTDTADRERDRQAILAMAGHYAVNFDFLENLALAPDYSLHEAHTSEAHELVLVVEDSPERIVLQHILVSERGHVVKHWRQDWIYQATDFWAYAGDYTWSQRHITPAEAAGKWLQTVWQVDDSPRYAGIGRWEHGHGISTWTSDITWRPLPRREHTTRNDYDVLVSTNRHTITPTGWVHEQDSYKFNRATDQYLAHEVGTNTYTRDDEFDLSPAESYWEKTHHFWAVVRDKWDALLSDNTTVGLAQPDDKDFEGSHLMALLQRANDLSHQELDDAQLSQLVDDTLTPFVRLD